MKEQVAIGAELGPVDIADIEGFAIVQDQIGFRVEIRVIEIAGCSKHRLARGERELVVAIAAVRIVDRLGNPVRGRVDAEDLPIVIEKHLGIVGCDCYAVQIAAE